MFLRRKIRILIDIRAIENQSGLGTYTRNVVLPVANELSKTTDITVLRNTKSVLNKFTSIIFRSRPLNILEQIEFLKLIHRIFFYKNYQFLLFN